MPIRTLFVSAAVAIAATTALATPAQACTGTVCDVVNDACVLVRGEACVR